MTEPEYAGPNAEQVRFWNETRGRTWVEQTELIDRQIGPLGQHAMQRAAVAAGERVLDVGCGCGQTTLELARRVGGGGSVVGADISRPMLTYAREVATKAAITNVRFQEADAQTYAFPQSAFDVVYSRFGVMFFADPRAAFANLRGALRPGGRVAFVCWRSMPENPWMAVPLMAAFQHVPPPQIPGPEDPGPFSFADRARVDRILGGAGLADVAFDPIDQDLVVGGGGDVDRAVDFLMQMGPAAAALREAGPEKVAAAVAAMRDALRPYYSPDAGVRMASAAWIVTARRP